MRVIWRDSLVPKEYKPIKYRDYIVQGSPQGWTTTIPGDNNLYKNHYSALNAIDAALGGTGRYGAASSKRQNYGIQIIGKKENNTA